MTLHLPDLIGKGYREFWHCRKRYRVLKGGKASKKSATTALWYIYHLMKYPEANLLVVRAVGNTHHDSTFAQLQWAIRRLRVSALWKATEHPLSLEFKPTRQRILFRGFDDVDKLASATVPEGYLCWVWVEEASEIRSEHDFDKLDLSVPRGSLPPPLFKQTTITFNPWSEKHWLKTRFFDHPDKDTAVFTTTYLCNEFLDEVDRRRYERMKTERPQLYRVAGLGDWGIADGLVFTDWEVSAFDPAALPAAFTRVFGLDYGYANDPTAFIAAAADPVSKRLYIFDEFYGTRLLNGEIAATILRKGYGKERIRADAAEPKSNEELRRLGISRLRAAVKGPDSVRSGIAALQEYHMIVHPSCVHTVAELSAYIWDKDGDGRGINRPVDRDNHLMDALRYAMTDIHTPRPTEEKPRIRPTFDPSDFRGGWG